METDISPYDHNIKQIKMMLEKDKQNFFILYDMWTHFTGRTISNARLKVIGDRFTVYGASIAILGLVLTPASHGATLLVSLFGGILTLIGADFTLSADNRDKNKPDGIEQSVFTVDKQKKIICITGIGTQLDSDFIKNLKHITEEMEDDIVIMDEIINVAHITLDKELSVCTEENIAAVVLNRDKIISKEFMNVYVKKKSKARISKITCIYNETKNMNLTRQTPKKSITDECQNRLKQLGVVYCDGLLYKWDPESKQTSREDLEPELISLS